MIKYTYSQISDLITKYDEEMKKEPDIDLSRARWYANEFADYIEAIVRILEQLEITGEDKK